MSIIGRKVFVVKRSSFYSGHWGFVLREEEEGSFFVGGGSIGKDTVPILGRDEFRVDRDTVIPLALPPDVIDEYLADTEIEWEIPSDQAVFFRRIIPLVNLEEAFIRPLRLEKVDRGMVSQSRTRGPIVLDADYSVIDGMHRIADALARRDLSIEAYVRIRFETSGVP